MPAVTRRALAKLPIALALPTFLASISRTRAQELPGVSATEIKIGNTDAYSGPASAYGNIARGETAYFKMVNDQGGIGGRKINFISYDDGYSPPKTVEQTRRMVEQDGVAFIFNPLGTAPNTAIQKYLNQHKVPTLFVSTGADKFGNPKEYPYTLPWAPSYRTEAQVYARYILGSQPEGKIAILYQNDDFGKDYVAGMKDVFADKFDQMVIKTASYEVADPTIDSQIVSLQASGADIFINAATPKFAAMGIRKVFDLGWKPTHFLSNVSISVASVMIPAGAEKGVGIITGAYLKDPTDPTWKDDAGMNEWRAFMKQYLPDADLADGAYVFAYGVTFTLMQVLKQCGTDFSRDNILRQATSLHDLVVPVALPGILVNSSPTNYHPMRQMQLQKWDGKTWALFGPVIQGSKG